MEKVVLVDKKGREVGLKEKYSAHKNPVLMHKAISVLVFDKDRLLMQKRSKFKKTWPLIWSNTCCSHPGEEEDYKEAAQRRLFEEMGIKANLKELFRFKCKARYNRIWGENEYDVVFVGEYKGKVKPNPEEVKDYKWINLKELKKDISENPGLYTPWFKLIFERI